MKMEQFVAMLAHLIESGQRDDVEELVDQAAEGGAGDRDRLLEMADHLHTHNFACSA